MQVSNHVPPGFAKLRAKCRVMDQPTVSRVAADMVIDRLKDGRGTILTPGCNTPLLMYQALAQDIKSRGFLPLLKGERGGASMGMIDAVEWAAEHRLNFRHYYYQNFLRLLLSEPSLPSSGDGRTIIRRIDQAFEILRNIHVPATEGGIFSGRRVAAFDSWLRARSPIDLVILGLGPDHIAFLGPGETIDWNGPLAKKVPLWEDIRDWKWNADSAEACSCVEAGACPLPQAPSHALTVSLKTILEAKRTILMATGGRKAPYVKRLIEGPYDPLNFPAHYLAEAQGEVTILLDETAAAQVSF